MTRRNFLQSSAAITMAPMARPLSAAQHIDKPPTKMGVAWTSYMTVWRPKDTLAFLDRCHELGAAGIQGPIHGDPAKIRARAEQLGMYVEAMVSIPRHGAVAAFEKQLQDAKAAGATALRDGFLGGRRYETFSSLAQWQEQVARAHRAIEEALPLLDKYKIPLGLENHKDWTADEAAALMKKYSSEYFGACLDFGNNISLLDDPMYVVEKLAPYTVVTHMKNMGVESDPDGFLLSEVLLSDGFMDLPRMISLVKQARPNTHMSLEMITRDPLKVPCLTDKYWATFPDRNGIYLARTLKLVQEKSNPSKPLPRMSQLPHDAQLRLENENVKKCLDYARENLTV